MSQSGRLTLNAPVPGAGIQTVTGNAGGPVPGDGAANVNLLGVGTITVTGNPGANTLVISSAGAPALYPTDNLIALPGFAGNLNIVGGPNINTDALVLNTVTINLNDNVVIPGFFEADDDITSDNGDITAAVGDIISVIGDVIAGNQIIGNGGGVFHDNVLITANGLETTGATILNDLNRGVVQVDAAHTLFSDEGLDGQILIGSTVGPAQWANITAGSRIAIVNTPNGIQINAVPQLPSGFHTDVGNAVPAAGILNILGGSNISTNGGGNTVGIRLDDNILVDSVRTTGLQDPGIITAPNCSIQSGFDITSANNITVGHDLNVNDTAGTTHLYVANTTTLNIEINGVLQTDADGLVTATNSNHILPAPPINGQVLISGPVAPAWNALTSADGTVVINTAVANHIDLSAPGATQPLAFRAQLDFSVPYAGNAGTPPYLFGTLLPLNETFDTAGAFYQGDGVAAPATFTAPYNGIYSFTLTACISFQFSYGFDTRSVWLRIIDTTAPYTYEILQPATSPTGGAPYFAQPGIANLQFTQVIYVAAGSVIQFGLEPKRRMDMVPINYIIGPNVFGGGQCNITGFLVRRI
jgi:hypothetical protein